MWRQCRTLMELLPIADDGPSAAVRVLAVADDPLARGGLAALVDSIDQASLAGQAAAYDDLVALAEVYQADVVVWDLGSGDDDAVDRLAEVSGSIPAVVALLDEASLATQVWAAGAKAILHRDVSRTRLSTALHAAVEGAIVLDAAFGEVLIRRPDPLPSLREPLTPREYQVLRLLAEGHANKSIAAELEVTENTVKFHVNAVLGKLGAQSRTEAVTRAVRQGIIPL